MNMYLQFISNLHNEWKQTVEILPNVRQKPAYFTYNQYHGCWCPGEARSSCDIDYVEPE